MGCNFLPYEEALPPAPSQEVPAGRSARFVAEVADPLKAEGKLEVFYARYRADGWGQESSISAPG